MPSFRGNNRVVIQPATKSISYRFHVTTCSSVTANDGCLPFEISIISATATAKTADGTVETGLISATVVSTPNIDLSLSWPTNGAGRYKITFILVLSDGSEMELDFHRLVAEDL